ncbi:MAG: glutamate 5-kinase [Pseudomonadota bacterium]
MTDPLSNARRIVVKIGSALVADAKEGRPRAAWIGDLAADLAALRDDGKDVMLVSSGAIALGRRRLGPHPPRRLEEKQAAAALGQPLLMGAMAEAFAPLGIDVAQALLTLDDTERRRRWLNARATLETLLEAGALPVINENDSVATDEIRYGDNDRLAARVAQMVSADVLVLLSDIDGLYTADPRKDPSAKHVAILRAVGPEHEAMAGDAHAGSGGMATKLAAAKIAHAAGCATAITLGDRERPLRALADRARATWILPKTDPETARRSWLRGHLTPEGSIVVDDGAARALETGASLLPVGVSAVAGRFQRGAAVSVKTKAGAMIAKGVVAYSAEEIDRIKGLQSDAAEAILGFRGRPAVIHRNDLVLDHPS